MRFKAKPVNDLTDVTLDLEQLEQQGIFNDTALGGALAGKLPNPTLATGTVLQLLSTGTTRKLTFGTISLVWTAATTSAAVTLSHGLGAAPQATFTQLQGAGVFGLGCTVTAVTSTQITFQGFTTAGGVLTGTFGFYWMAFG